TPGLGLLLKHVEHIDRRRIANRLDAAKSVAMMIRHDLHDSGASEPAERLGVAMLASQLRDIEGVTYPRLYCIGHRTKVAPTRPNPDQRLGRNELDHRPPTAIYSEITLFATTRAAGRAR